MCVHASVHLYICICVYLCVFVGRNVFWFFADFSTTVYDEKLDKIVGVYVTHNLSCFVL